MRKTCALLIAFALFALGTPAQKKKLTLESMNQDVTVSEPEFSPDSKMLLFVSNKSGRNKMWVMGVDGSNPRLLLNDAGAESSPSWSPDGKWISFQRNEGGQPDIWMVDSKGQNLRRVTNDKEGERAYVWSPNGKSIAFISDRARNQEAYKEKNQDIYVVDVASGKVEQLTTETNAWDETRWQPEWSPDSKWIAYVSNRTEYFADDLWLVEVATKKSRRITTDVRVMSSPVWSPDGKHIVMHGLPNAEFWHSDMSDLYVVNMPEMTVRRLQMNTYATDSNGSARPAWSADSKFIYFRKAWQGDSNLWSVPVDGTVATQMSYEEGSMRNFAVSPNGEAIAYVRSTPVSGGDMYVLETRGGAPRQLTNWNEDFDGVKAPQRISYRSGDGHYMQGYLFLPPDVSSGKKFPCLVQAHGGGTNSYGNGFHSLEQYIAQQGFVVIGIEYRGSSGFGRAFQKLALGEWGAGQGWDAVAAAKFLKSQPYCNGKIGMYGGSYGARMTMAAITRDPSPFTAVAPFYGSYDWETGYPLGDRVEKFFTLALHFWYRPGENPDLYQHTAAIRHLDKVSTTLPFLIIHGERDRRTPYQQALTLVDTLKKRGNPVEFYSYPEEGHGFRLPKNRIHAYTTMLEFFRKHLQ